MKKNNKIKSSLFAIMLLTTTYAIAQKDLNLNTGRVITPSLPFLLINNDQQTTGLADASVGLLQYNNSGIDNSAKAAFNKSDFYGSLNYSNYLGSLVNDMSISSIYANYKISKNDNIGFAINNFKGGSILNTDQNAVLLDKYSSGEYNIKLNYAKKISEKLAIGVGLKYINSSLFNSNSVGGIYFNRSQKLGADISLFHRGVNHDFDDKSEYRYFGKKGRKYFDYGFTITDLGAKLKYNGDNRFSFMPTNMKFGVSYNIYVQDKQKLSIIGEVNKLLAPTPPIIDSDGHIIKGQDMGTKSWIGGITKSFNDAPEGIKEEIKEIIWKTAIEYSLEEKLIFRAGYFNETKMKGNRKNLAIGIGLNIKDFGANISYSVPIGSYNPLGNTLRLGVSVNLNKKDKLDMNRPK